MTTNTTTGKEKVHMDTNNLRKYFAITFYVLLIALALGMSYLVFVPAMFILLIMLVMGITFFGGLGMDLVAYARKKKPKLGKRITNELKKILKEVLKFIPVWILSIIVATVVVMFLGQASNQTSIEGTAETSSTSAFLMLMLFESPILEEYIFRFLPSKFIKNQNVYIIVSSLVFAAFHVYGDPNPFAHIWVYIIRAFYYGYRYSKTQDIFVTMSLHGFNNLMSVLIMMI